MSPVDLWTVLTAVVTPFTAFLIIIMVGACIYVAWVESGRED